MEYRELGSTGINISIVGIGAWQMGGPDGENGVGHGWGDVDDSRSIKIIHSAQEMGVNLIDTADIYGSGHSERIIGEALKGRREKWIVATKGGLVKDPDNRGQYFDASAVNIRNACEASLKRLQIDTIDFYQLHGIPEDDQIPDTMKELSKLRDEGKIRFYGISVGDVGSIKKLQAYGEVDIVQIGFSLLNRNEEAALNYCYEQGIGTLIRTPLSWGAAFGRYAEEKPPTFEFGDNRHKTDPEQIIAEHKKGLHFSFLWENINRSPAQAALRFVLDTKGVTAVIPGTKKLDHLIDNVGTATIQKMSSIEMGKIEDVRAEWNNWY